MHKTTQGLIVTLLAACGLMACRSSTEDGRSEPRLERDRHRLSSVPIASRGALWRYFDNKGVATPGAPAGGDAWKQATYDDSAWAMGPAELGYGDGDELTIVNCCAPAPNTSSRLPTTYFRRAFNVADPAAFPVLKVSAKYDDGIILYLNGREVYRANMPSGAVDFATWATRDQGQETAFFDAYLDLGRPENAGLLRAGQNVLAAEVHQTSAGSSDISFDAELSGAAKGLIRGPYLQNGTQTSAVIRWRTNVPATSRVRYGKSVGVLSHEAGDATPKLDHEVQLTQLTPNTTYYYAIASEEGILVGADAEHFLVTLPPAGASKPTRIWVLGDAGRANANQASVKDAYLRTLGRDRYTDVILALGDNAYETGQDAEFGKAVFEMYPEFLRKSFYWSCVGNHEHYAASGSGEIGPNSDFVNVNWFEIGGLHKEAEQWSAQSGTQSEATSDAGGGQNVGFITGGDWLRYDGLDIPAGASQVKLRMAANFTVPTGGKVEVRLGALTADPVAVCDTPSTGGWQSFTDVTCAYSGAPGIQTVFLTFVGPPVVLQSPHAVQASGDAAIPFYKLFNFPSAGEAGGLASGTERYYSYDYGDIHFVVLDSMTTSLTAPRSTRQFPQAMLDWLQEDLAATTAKWIIAAFHHPPYSKGSHDSDNPEGEYELGLARRTLLPILEDHGVDLVLSGHSHSYERSFFANGHHGPSGEFSAAHKVQPGDGRISGLTGAYTKPLLGGNTNPNKGAVYVVSGSAGGISGGALNHPMMVVNWNKLGSFVVDVNGARLDARFLTQTGGVWDEFTLLKGSQTNQAPRGTLTATHGSGSALVNAVPPVVVPANPALVAATGTVSLSATDVDGTIARVEFFLDSESLGGAQVLPPFTAGWNAKPGDHNLHALVTDNGGATAMSNLINFVVAPTGPTAPTNLVATAIAEGQRIDLAWADRSNNEAGFVVERWVGDAEYQGAGSWVVLGTTKANVTAYTDSGLKSGVLHRYRVAAKNTTAQSAYTATAEATAAAGAPVAMVTLESSWKYHDQGVNLGTAWRAGGYDDAMWAQGFAELGYGDGDETTVVKCCATGTSSPKFVTTYFRRRFYVSNPAAYPTTEVAVRIRRDDGAVVFLNGTEAHRTPNLPAAPAAIAFNTLANAGAAVDGENEKKLFLVFPLSGGAIQPGWNTIAVEIHQHSTGSSDVSFDLELRKRLPDDSLCNAQDDDFDNLIDENVPNINGVCVLGDGECRIPGVFSCTSAGPLCRNNGVRPYDVTPPAITATASPSVLASPPNGKLVKVTLGVSATDNCSGTNNRCYVFSVKSNEPCKDKGVKDLCPDARIVNDTTIEVRNERTGSAPGGRVYEVRIYCVDQTGNVGTATVPVRVPH